MCCGGWLGRKNARRCGLNLLKYALALSREYSLLLFTSAPTLKTPPAGRHALESDNNGYLWNILLQEFALCVKSNNYREAADFHLSLSSIFANCQYHQKILHNPRDSQPWLASWNDSCLRSTAPVSQTRRRTLNAKCFDLVIFSLWTVVRGGQCQMQFM